MLIGPVFTRELVTAPRRPRFFLAPAVYVGALLILTCTAWLLLIGTQQVRRSVTWPVSAARCFNSSRRCS